ncbi:MAG: shikimate kinase [Gemmatimonadota bacterium]|nr:shikimate kinase [Gemmatimonadota bacterium]
MSQTADFSRLRGRQIFLTGFMATGKSKIGPILARRLDRLFVDTDELIVAAAGKSIPRVFAEDGEAAFRRIERGSVVKAAGMPDAVIALGGGAVTQEGNWDTIRASGVCLCLKASPETIFARLCRTEGERPLMDGLNDEERMEKIRSMLAARAPFYDRADAFVESTEYRTPEETVQLALTALKDIALQ